ncbi:hypothetical protein [Paraburkholderia caribensis]|nr:hypothetical protein [Paraburkholderia caribensis]
MSLMQQSPRSQRVGIFSGLFVALLALLAHNPFNGYLTDDALHLRIM